MTPYDAFQAVEDALETLAGVTLYRGTAVTQLSLGAPQLPSLFYRVESCSQSEKTYSAIRYRQDIAIEYVTDGDEPTETLINAELAIRSVLNKTMLTGAKVEVGNSTFSYREPGQSISMLSMQASITFSANFTDETIK